MNYLFKGAGGSGDLKIVNLLYFFRIIITSRILNQLHKISFMEFLLDYIAFKIKNKMVNLLPWQQQIIDS